MNELTMEQLQERVPAAFNTLGPSMKVSDRYRFLPTLPLIEEFIGQGFKPVSAAQQGSRHVGAADFARHFIRFEHPKLSTDSLKTLGDAKLQIILSTAHNGTAAHTLMVGIFRLICLNGMTAHTAGSKSRIIHTGAAQGKLDEALAEVKKQLPNIVTQIKTMQVQVLSDAAIRQYAIAVLMRRLGIESASDVDDTSIVDVLTTQRPEDAGNEAWKVMNRVQENLIRGNVRRWDTNNRLRNGRAVRSVVAQESVNKITWQEAVKIAC